MGNEEEFEQEVQGLQEEEVEEQVVETPEEEVAEEVVPKDQYDNIHKAMDRERHEKRELQQQFQEYKSDSEQKYARLDERLNTLNQVWGQTDEPDPEQIAQEKYAAQQKELDEIREQQKIINLTNTLNNQEASFAAQTPDYGAAKEHYFTTRLNSLDKLGYTQEQAQQQIAMETMQFSQTALSQNQNAAERLYAAAKESGYVPVTRAAEQKMETIKEGQEVSQMPKGGPPKGELTMETLANMTDEEFASLTEDQLRSVMGG